MLMTDSEIQNSEKAKATSEVIEAKQNDLDAYAFEKSTTINAEAKTATMEAEARLNSLATASDSPLHEDVIHAAQEIKKLSSEIQLAAQQALAEISEIKKDEISNTDAPAEEKETPEQIKEREILDAVDLINTYTANLTWEEFEQKFADNPIILAEVDAAAKRIRDLIDNEPEDVINTLPKIQFLLKNVKSYYRDVSTTKTALFEVAIEAIALRDPERAMQILKEKISTCDDSSETQQIIERSAQWTIERIIIKNKTIKTIEYLETDPQKSIDLYFEYKKKLSDMEGGSLWSENNTAVSEIELQIRKYTEKTTAELLKEGFDQALSFYRGLPDNTPGLYACQLQLRSFAYRSIPDEHTVKEKNKILQEMLADAPDVYFIGKDALKVTDGTIEPQQAGEMIQKLGELGNRDSLIARFEPKDLLESQKAELLPILFHAKCSESPGEILSGFNEYQAEYNKLSDSEKELLVNVWVKNPDKKLLRVLNETNTVLNKNQQQQLLKGVGIKPDFWKIDIFGDAQLLTDLGFSPEQLTSQVIYIITGYRIQTRGEKEDVESKAALQQGLTLLLKAFNEPENEILRQTYKSLDFSKVIKGLEAHPDKAADIVSLLNSKRSTSLKMAISESLSEFLSIPDDKRETYLEIFDLIDQSPSQEVQRIKEQLLTSLIEVEDPEAAYTKIESIFIKNNLPLVGKIFKVFEILYPNSRINNELKEISSPTLKEAGPRRRKAIIYSDLLRVHVESANPSLRSYIDLMSEAEPIFLAADQSGIDSLTDSQRSKLEQYLKKLETLRVNSALGINTQTETEPTDDIFAQYNHLKQNLGVKAGQSVNERIAEMFVKPAGYESLEEISGRIRGVKQETHQRNLQQIDPKTGQIQTLKEGDLLKGVDMEFLSNILQNGSVSKEYLGADAGSDSTPFDTDLSKIEKPDLNEGIKSALQHSLAIKHASGLVLAIRDRGQFNDGDPRKNTELFPTPFLGQKHYGIRTGFPATQIDFFIATDDLAEKPDKLENIYFEIAQNGYYIPVVDQNGSVLFSPEDYSKYREPFEGLERFDGQPFNFISTTHENPQEKEVTEYIKHIADSREQTTKIGSVIQSSVTSALGSAKINFRAENDTSIIGAELIDIGSTGRHTNTLDNYDFDYTLKLDAGDFERAPELASMIKSLMVMEKDDSHDEQGYHQLRAKGVTSFAGQKFPHPIDIDIGFAKKSDLSVYGSHDALREKLANIKKTQGQEAYEQTIANIVTAKKILKAGHAYKKLEDGGFGGIGVENWILANGGNLDVAFQNFKQAAYENGNRISLDLFREKYKLLDPGVNVKFNNHDNFIFTLKEPGYQAMLDTIENYLQGNR